MKSVKSQRHMIDRLEQRMLLSATLIRTIPSPTFQANGTPQTLALGSYFNDPTIPTGDTLVQMITNLAAPNNLIPLYLTNAATPNTVANFLHYITSGEYANSIFHRSVPGFVLQGGGYTADGNGINAFGSINGESATEVLGNTTGTIAMALSAGPNSASSEWFFNLGNNDGTGRYPNLNNASDGGPFTVFGQVIYQGMSVLNYIANLPVVNDMSNQLWNALPVQSGTNGSTVSSEPASNLVTINPVIIPTGMVYLTNSSNPAVVTPKVTAGNLTLTPGSVGTATVTVMAEDQGLGTATTSFTVTVAGNAPAPTVSVASESGTIGTNTQILFPVTLSAASASATTLNYTLTAGTASGSDFQSTGSTLTIPAGTPTASIPVNILADTSGAAETFTLTLSSLSSNAVFANGNATETATGTINPLVGVTTTTALSASSPAVVVNGPETFTAIVTAANGTTPAGTVTFDIGGSAIGSSALSNGVATLSTDLSSPGNEIVTAVYGGDSSHLASTASPLTVNVATLEPVISRNPLPASVVGGTTVHGSPIINLTNDTSAAEVGMITVNLYASTNGAIDANSVRVGTITRKVKIAPGKSIPLPVPVTSIAALSAGTYSLLAQTLDTANVTSNAASGPGLTIAAPVDLLSETITRLLLPNAVVAGSKSSVVALVKITNSGNVSSTGMDQINLYASPDGTVASGTLIKPLHRNISLKPGKSTTVVIPLGTYPLVADGNYFVVAQVTDSKGAISQTVSTGQVNIAAARLDLSDAVVSIPTAKNIARPFSFALSISDAGNYTVIKSVILSVGLSPTGSAADAFPVFLGTAHVNVKPGGTQLLHLKASLPKTASAGDYYLIATLDPYKTLSDSNFANNFCVSATTISIG